MSAMGGSGGGNNNPSRLGPVKSGMLNALSQMRNWFLLEKNGGPLDPMLWTPDHATAYMWIAAKQAFEDSIIWVVGDIILGTILYLYGKMFAPNAVTTLWFFHVKGSILYWLVELLGLSGMAYSTVVMIQMGMMRAATLPKKAFNTIWITRTSMLMSLSIVILAGLGLCSKMLGQPATFEHICLEIYKIKPSWGLLTYHYIGEYLRPRLVSAGLESVVYAVISSFLPIVLLPFLKYKKKNAVMGPSNSR